MTRQQRRQYERTFLRHSAAVENKYIGPVVYALNAQYRPVLNYAQEYGMTAALLSVDALVLPEPVAKVIRRIYIGEGQRAARNEYTWLNQLYGREFKDFPLFDNWLEILGQFFGTFGAEAIVRVTQTTKDTIKELLNEAIAGQWTMPELRDRIIGIEGIGRRRANVIARTEVISALNFGSNAAAQKAPILFIKEWLSTLDKRTRRTHVQLNGEQQELNVPFSNGGQYPGDPTLSAKERIQCRCTAVHIAKRDEYGRLIRKVAA